MGHHKKAGAMCALCLATFMAAYTTTATAGYAIGEVRQVLVGRLGDQVYVDLAATQYVSWPCGGTHPSGFRYAFLLSSPAGKSMLATVLVAQATGKPLQIVGAGTCSIDPTIEDANYVVLQP